MAYNIEKRIIPGLYNGKLSASNMVVAHESGNPNNTGANSLENEISTMTRNHQNAFVSHWVGGGGRIVQIAPTGKVQWGAGPKANGSAYAQVELARTENKKTFEKDYAAYVWLLRHLASEAAIPLTVDSNSNRGIKSHNWVTHNLGGTTHTDPYGYLASFGISKDQFKKDVEGGGSTYKPQKTQTGSATAKGKSISQMASEVIAGKHGQGNAARQKSLGISSAEYEKVRAEVNRRLGASTKPSKKPAAPKKSVAQMAKEVIAGKHGNGHAARQKSLGISNAEYAKVKNEVNKILMGDSSKPKKSIDQMAKEVIAGKHGNGHETRRKSLGISKAEYEKVRAAVNKML